MIELDVDDLDHQGRGVGRHDGMVVLVEGALPGERVRARVLHRARRHWVASLQDILRASPHRRRPPCILADHCGGCSLQSLDPTGQALWKEQRLAQTLRRLGGLDVTIRPLLAAPNDLGHRNRAVIPLQRDQSGRLRAGYYRRGSHRIVNMNRCPVLDARIDRLIAPLKADLDASGWPADPQLGVLRHLALRLGHGTGEVLITLVATHAQLPNLAHLADSWMARWPEVVGVGVNLQPQPTNVLFGPETRVVAGRARLLERFAGLELEIAADTFFQVNTPQAERVVPLLLEALPDPPGELIDAYCGIGTLSLPLAQQGWTVRGLEVHPGAVDLACANARRLALDHRARFSVVDVAGLLADALAAQGGQGCLLLDPPRRGLDRSVVDAIRSTPPQTLLYLSCDPATLSRDLALLCAEQRFEPAWVQPIDFFPATSHVEALAVLNCAARP